MENLLEDVKFWARLVIILKNHKMIKTQKDFLKYIGCKRTNDPSLKQVLDFLKNKKIIEIDDTRTPFIYSINPDKLFIELKKFKYQEVLVETMIEPGIYKKEKWQ
jgi:hypothetical protein